MARKYAGHEITLGENEAISQRGECAHDRSYMYLDDLRMDTCRATLKFGCRTTVRIRQ